MCPVYVPQCVNLAFSSSVVIFPVCISYASFIHPLFIVMWYLRLATIWYISFDLTSRHQQIRLFHPQSFLLSIPVTRDTAFTVRQVSTIDWILKIEPTIGNCIGMVYLGICCFDFNIIVPFGEADGGAPLSLLSIKCCLHFTLMPIKCSHYFI